MATPAQAATVNSLSCQSRLNFVVCVASTSSSGPTSYTWVVDGKVLPQQQFITRLDPRLCSTGKLVPVAFIVVDHTSTASMQTTVRCRSGF